MAAGVYTMWWGPELVYVSMVGHGLSGETVPHHRADAKRVTGLFAGSRGSIPLWAANRINDLRATVWWPKSSPSTFPSTSGC